MPWLLLSYLQVAIMDCCWSTTTTTTKKSTALSLGRRKQSINKAIHNINFEFMSRNAERNREHIKCSKSTNEEADRTMYVLPWMKSWKCNFDLYSPKAKTKPHFAVSRMGKENPKK